MSVDEDTSPRRMPAALGRKRLQTLSDVAGEMERVYKAVTAGKLAPKDGNSLVYMLTQLGRVLEVTRIERVVEEIEERTQGVGRLQ